MSDAAASAHACVGTLTGHTDNVFAACLAGPGVLATGSSDDTVRLWDVATRACLATIRTGHTDFIRAACVAAPGVLATGSDDRTVRLFDVPGAVPDAGAPALAPAAAAAATPHPPLPRTRTAPRTRPPAAAAARADAGGAGAGAAPSGAARRGREHRRRRVGAPGDARRRCAAGKTSTSRALTARPFVAAHESTRGVATQALEVRLGTELSRVDLSQWRQYTAALGAGRERDRASAAILRELRRLAPRTHAPGATEDRDVLARLVKLCAATGGDRDGCAPAGGRGRRRRRRRRLFAPAAVARARARLRRGRRGRRGRRRRRERRRHAAAAAVPAAAARAAAAAALAAAAAARRAALALEPGSAAAPQPAPRLATTALRPSRTPTVRATRQHRRRSRRRRLRRKPRLPHRSRRRCDDPRAARIALSACKTW